MYKNSVVHYNVVVVHTYVGKHLSLRGGIDFEGPWRDLGGDTVFENAKSLQKRYP